MTTAQAQDAPETLRDSRYRGLRVLGHGSQGTTYEATDVRDGRPVAIKRFVVRGAKSWKEVELAEREAKVLASVAHPLVPKYVEHFEEGGSLYLVTEMIEGESLAALRARGGRLGVEEIVRMLRDLDEVLSYLHGRSPPIVHRDVKPGNIVRRSDGRFALVDFGAVRDRLRPAGGSTVVGTFGYMAPEQFQGRAMPASDVYGAGATVLTMLTGEEPEALPHRGLAIDVRAALGKAAPEELIRAVEQMVDPDPDRRAGKVPVPELRRARPPKAERVRESGKRERKRREKERRREEKWKRRVRTTGVLSRAIMTVALVIAAVAVQLACRLIVPLVLNILSILFGQSLRKAARRVASAGVLATRAIRRTQDHVTYVRMPGEEVAPHPSDPIRVRVVGADEQRERRRDREREHEHDAEAELEAEASSKPHKRSRS